MRTLLLVSIAFLLTACGAGTDARGSIDWDAGVAVIEIKGDGAYVLELNNNGGVDLEISGRNPVNKDTNRVSPLKKGSSLRHTVPAGPRLYRLTRIGEGKASVSYVVKSDDDLAVSTRIEP